VEVETAGVWLIGAGSLLIAFALVIGSARSGGPLEARGPFSLRAERLWFAVECTGALLAASGAVLIAVENPPPGWLLAAVPLAYAFFHLVAAWKLRQYWRTEVVSWERPGVAIPEESKARYRLAKERATWRWALRHIYSWKATDEYE
jgi:hypothetical protein